MPRKAMPFWDRVDPTEECWLWQGNRNSDGYGTVRYNGKTMKAHRVAWMMVHGQIPHGMQVCHRCDNPPCVNPSHLFLGTNADNMRDRQKKGRSKNLFQQGHRINEGERCHKSKITRLMVVEIRNRFEAGDRIIDIASDVGLHHSQVSRIANRKAWTHV